MKTSLCGIRCQWFVNGEIMEIHSTYKVRLFLTSHTWLTVKVPLKADSLILVPPWPVFESVLGVG